MFEKNNKDNKTKVKWMLKENNILKAKDYSLCVVACFLCTCAECLFIL